MARERDDRDLDDEDDRPRRPRRDRDEDYDDRPKRDIPNNLVIAILSVFCCWPLAIVAIIKAASVNGLVAKGQYAEAEKASADAKKFATIGIVVGIVVNVIAVIAQVMLAAGANR